MFVLTIIGLMLTGLCIGRLLKLPHPGLLKRAITVLIWLLLFLMGLEVGSNPDLFASLDTLGVEALAMAAAGVAGSCLAAWALWASIDRINRRDIGNSNSRNIGNSNSQNTGNCHSRKEGKR